MLFLAGIALVNLKGMEQRSDNAIISESEIANTAWRPTHVGEMRLEQDTPLTLHFNSGNEVVGHSGCNRFFGEYIIRDGLLEIGPLGSTRMACPEPENSFEVSYLAALQAARSLSIAERRLTMRDEKGHIVARFLVAEREGAQ
jgi:heat shock protein HslJ